MLATRKKNRMWSWICRKEKTLSIMILKNLRALKFWIFQSKPKSPSTKSHLKPMRPKTRFASIMLDSSVLIKLSSFISRNQFKLSKWVNQMMSKALLVFCHWKKTIRIQGCSAKFSGFLTCRTRLLSWISTVMVRWEIHSSHSMVLIDRKTFSGLSLRAKRDGKLKWIILSTATAIRLLHVKRST